MMPALFEFLVHLDRHLDLFILQYGPWTYALLFLIVFAETGVVVTPFLPGDSLLFVAGTLAARGLFDPILLGLVLASAAIAGDTVNYWIGQAAGPRVFRHTGSRVFRREHLDRTHRFYERYGAVTIVLARFVPIVRTFAPFVAGIGRMSYRRFISYNVAGGALWVASFVTIGYSFGNIPIVRQNFALVVVAIIMLSVAPAAVEAWRRRGH